MELFKDNFCISTDKAKLDIPYIHQFLRTTYWAEHIPMEILQKSIDGSICFGVYDGKNQVGFARVISDQATYAYLADVFIDPLYRKRGLSRSLLETILGHPDLQGLRVWELATNDAQGLYAKFGFKPPEMPARIMRIVVPDIYKSGTVQ